MAYASLLEVWNAGTNVLAQGLDMATQEKKYKQDIELFNANMDAESRQNLIAKARIEIYDDGGQNFQKNPDYPATFQEYVNRLQTEWQSTWSSKNQNSRYYVNNLKQIQAKNNIELQRKVISAELSYKSQEVNALYEDEIEKIANNSDYSPEQKLQKFKELTDRTRGAAGWDREQYEKAQDGYRARVLGELLKYTPGKGVATEAIQDRYEKIAAEGLRAGNPETGEAAGEYITLPKAKEAIETARDGAVKAQEAYNFRGLLEMNNEYELSVKDYLNAVRGGDPGRVQAAYGSMVSLYREGIKEKAAALGLEGAALGDKSSEYNYENRPQIWAMFPAPPEFALEGSGGGGSGSGGGISTSMLEKLVKGQRVNLIQLAARQAEDIDGNQVTYEKAREKFKAYTMQQIERAGLSPEDGQALLEPITNFNAFMDDIINEIKVINPSWHNSYIEPTKAYFKGLMDTAKKSGKIEDMQFVAEEESKALSLLYDIYTGTFGNDLKPADWQKIFGRLNGTLLDDQMYWKADKARKSKFEGAGNLGKMTRFLEEEPAFLHTDRVGNIITGGNLATYEAYKTALTDEFKTLMAVKDENISLGNEEEGDDDFSGVVKFTVTGEGLKDGVYKFVSAPNNEQELRKLNEEGDWGPVPQGGLTGTMGATGEEVRAQQAAALMRLNNRERGERNNRQLASAMEGIRDTPEDQRVNAALGLMNLYANNPQYADYFNGENWVKNGMMPDGRHQNITQDTIKDAKAREKVLSLQKKILDNLTGAERSALLSKWEAWGMPILYRGNGSSR
jgi:hypothetical protein